MMNEHEHNAQHDRTTDAIERELASMTAWEGDTGRGTGVGGAPGQSSVPPWEAAWEREHAPSTKRHAGGRLTRALPARWLIGAGSAVIVLLVFVGVLLPSLGKARNVSAGRYESIAQFDDAAGAGGVTAESQSRMAMSQPAEAGESARVRDAADSGGMASRELAFAPPRAAKMEAAPAPSADAPVRHVIRTATIDLKADDVSGVFNRAAKAIDEAAGEYVENSSLAGEGEQAVGRLTLRVRPDRLEAVLATLRGMGEVVAEHSSADDVTDQVIDLDARLTNERRVETELQELLASRENASLDEILKLRESLREVRERIERLTAQRDALAGRVSLASVAVSIRSAKPPSEPAESGFGASLSREVGGGWRIGLAHLVASLAWLVRVAVGGLVWWLVLIAAGLGVLVYRRRADRALRLAITGVPGE